LQKIIVELMFLKRNVEIFAKRFEAFVAFADPFGSEFADQASVLELMRENSPAYSVTSF